MGEIFFFFVGMERAMKPITRHQHLEKHPGTQKTIELLESHRYRGQVQMPIFMYQKHVFPQMTKSVPPPARHPHSLSLQNQRASYGKSKRDEEKNH
jgi:hypothetical protein